MSGMTVCWRRWDWKLALASWLAIGGVYASSGDCAFAQITPDGTLPNNSRVRAQDNIRTIEGGTQAGGNLFHSFGEFSVPTGGTAFFNNAVDIQNIISRVTGGSVSNIDGLIRANGNANLFLINPNGIVFGANASLNVGGSFVASTANALQFGNLGFFSATDKNIPSPLLTINPSALLFNQINQNFSIQNNSVAAAGRDPAGLNANGLRVPDGKSLLLVGGNVSMNGGRLNANGGRVELGGLAESGTVALDVNGDNLSLKFPENVERADVSFSNRSGIYVTGAGGGNLAVNARNLEILGGSIVSAGIGQGLGTPETVAGDITLNATGEIKVAGTGSIVRNLVRLGSQGNGGNITIDSGSFSLQDGAQLEASTFGQGNAGNVNLNVTGAIEIAGSRDRSPSGIFSRVETGTVGNGGNITINSGSFSLRDGAQLNASTRGQGNGGNVTVRALGAVDLANSRILSTVDPGGVGKGGNIDINAATLSLTDGAQLLTRTSYPSATQPAGRGDAGNVNLNVTGTIDIAGNRGTSPSGIFSRVETGTVGNAGNITIDSGSFSLRDGAQLSASTRGQGNAGNVTVRARDSVSLANSRILSTVDPGGVGKGGNIDINAATLSLTDGAQLLTRTSGASDTQPAGRGDAGNVNLNVTGAIDIAGSRGTFPSGIFSRVETGTVGNGGNITIDSGSFSLRDGAQLNVSTRGQGNGGNVTVRARDSVSLANSRILSTVDPGGVGKGGNIDINAGSFSLRDGAQVSTGALGAGNAGNIILNAPIIALNGVKTGVFNTLGSTTGPIIKVTMIKVNDGGYESEIPKVTIEAAEQTINPNAEGNSGNINLTSRLLTVTNGARLTTSTYGRGNAGSINLNTQKAVFSGIDINGSSSGVFSAVEQKAVGNAGTIKMTTNELILKGGAQLVASSFGQGNAGTITIQASDKFLINGVNSNGSPTGLFAESRTGQGGNIGLEIGNLLMLHDQSLISATSGVAGSNGLDGNINIDTKFLIAVPKENSDIVATGFGRTPGSNIKVKASGIFGTQFRQQLSPESDIVATGQVTLNTPDVDPNSGLVNLPAVPVDTKVAQDCTAGGAQAQSEFIITGRGGLPPNPSEALSTDAVQVDLITLNSEVTQPSTTAISTSRTSPTPPPIVEATGWVIDANGDIILTANAPTVTPHTSWQKTADCRAFNQPQGR